jgi:thiol-disulfide isomerase/thioredoxin
MVRPLRMSAEPTPAEPPDPAAAESGAGAEPAEPPPEKLEGEDQQDLIGIMYSEKKWIVPAWAKAVFFWAALFTLVPLAGYTVWKRYTFQKLLVDSVVEPENWKNVPAPEVTLPSGDGAPEVSLSAMRGKWVLVNFWATWCAPCRDEMPSMEMLNRRFQRDKLPIELVAITVDEDWRQVNRFFGDTRPTFHVLWDREKRASFTYGTRKFPETYLIDPEGRIAAKFVGPRDWYNQATVQYFDEVIAGRRPPAS